MFFLNIYYKWLNQFKNNFVEFQCIFISNIHNECSNQFKFKKIYSI